MVELGRRDHDGFRELIELLHEFILRICRAIDPGHAEDDAQETQVVLLTKFQSFRGSTDAELQGWVRTIACNICYARLKRIKRAPQLADNEVAAYGKSPSQAARAKEEKDSVVALLSELTDDERTAELLRHIEHWSIAAIAELLERTPDAIGGLLKRGMAKLRSKTTLSQWSQLMGDN